jgi:hypothetical protein
MESAPKRERERVQAVTGVSEEEAAKWDDVDVIGMLSMPREIIAQIIAPLSVTDLENFCKAFEKQKLCDDQFDVFYYRFLVQYGKDEWDRAVTGITKKQKETGLTTGPLNHAHVLRAQILDTTIHIGTSMYAKFKYKDWKLVFRPNGEHGIILHVTVPKRLKYEGGKYIYDVLKMPHLKLLIGNREISSEWTDDRRMDVIFDEWHRPLIDATRSDRLYYWYLLLSAGTWKVSEIGVDRRFDVESWKTIPKKPIYALGAAVNTTTTTHICVTYKHACSLCPGSGFCSRACGERHIEELH